MQAREGTLGLQLACNAISHTVVEATENTSNCLDIGWSGSVGNALVRYQVRIPIDFWRNQEEYLFPLPKMAAIYLWVIIINNHIIMNISVIKSVVCIDQLSLQLPWIGKFWKCLNSVRYRLTPHFEDNEYLNIK